MSNGSAVLVIGPAGSGKSSLSKEIYKYCRESLKRSTYLFNLDPAAEDCLFEDLQLDQDIRNLISVVDVMSELDLGPNGALIFCMNYLNDHADWLQDAISEFSTQTGDNFIIVDCPGQIEIYINMNTMCTVVETFKNCGFNVVVAYLIDCIGIAEPSRYFSIILSSISATMNIEASYINVLTKIDTMIPSKRIQKRINFINQNDNFDNIEINENERYSINLNNENLNKSEETSEVNTDDDLNSEDDPDVAYRTEVINQLVEPPSLKHLKNDIFIRNRYSFLKLTEAISTLINDYGIDRFQPFSIFERWSIRYLIQIIDMTTQFGEQAEHREYPEHEEEDL